MNQSPQSNDRHIRVFICSTFRDMQAERDILIKKIFPQLRKLCEERTVTWTEIDLRWGITTEQASEGKVLPLCLEEIHRCRPYFIGLLGERYGWVPEPDSIPADLLESQPWLKQHLQHSVTELEILRGVFSEEPMHGHAYFYFRDPQYLANVPAQQRQDYTAENPDAAKKLAKLKQKIRGARDEQVCELRENYANPEQLGEWILGDFTKLIDCVYPKDKTPNPLDREAAHHEAYARSRRLAFVGRDDLLRRLDEHAATPGKPLVLTGESGCGKSALLAEWADRWRKEHPDDLIIEHYIGGIPDSADWQELVRRVLSEIRRAFAITEGIPVGWRALRDALNDWLVKASGSRRVVLVLDALNRLSDDGAARQLLWLPVVFPANCRVLISTQPDETLDTLHKRAWPELKVPLFERADIAPAALAYFQIFSKTPPPDIVTQLESTPAACNPLYLRAVLDELRQFGKHDELGAKTADYLSAENSKQLYQRILARWEEDFGGDLVQESLRLIWAAHHGLSETEVADLLGRDGQPLPRAKWTPFYLAAESNLAHSRGLLNLVQSELREAVQTRLLPTHDDETAAHLRLADYFEPRRSGRRTEELPWQLSRAGAWERLARSLSDLNLLAALRLTMPSTLETFWREIESHSALRALDIYHRVLEQPEEFKYECKPLGDTVALLLKDLGHPSEALTLYRRISAEARRSKNLIGLQDSLGNEAELLEAIGRFDEAISLLKEQLQICRRLDESPDIGNCLGDESATYFIVEREGGKHQAATRNDGTPLGLLRDSYHPEVPLGNLARLLQQRNQLDEALQLHKEEERVCRASNNLRGLRISLNNQGMLFRRTKHFEEATRLLTEAVNLADDQEDRRGVADSLANKVLVLRDMNQLDAAMDCCTRVESLWRELSDVGGVADSIVQQGLIFGQRGDHSKALDCFQEAEPLFRAIGNATSLSAVVALQGCALCEMGSLDAALARYDGAIALSRSRFDGKALAEQLESSGGILFRQGRFPEASDRLREAESIFSDIGDIERSRSLRGKHSVILQQRGIALMNAGDLIAANELFKEQEQICREIDRGRGIQAAKGLQGMVCKLHGDFGSALVLFKDQERLSQQLDLPTDRATAQFNQADILSTKLQQHSDAVDLAAQAYATFNGASSPHAQAAHELLLEIGASLVAEAEKLRTAEKHSEALAKLEKAETVASLLNEKRLHAKILAVHALIHAAKGDLERALCANSQQETTCREIADAEGLANCLNDRGVIFRSRGDTKVAREVWRQQEQFAREHNLPFQVATSLINQASVLCGDKRPRDATPLIIEALSTLGRESGEAISVARNVADLVKSELAAEARSYMEAGDIGKALELFEEIERVCRQLGAVEQLKASLEIEASFLEDMLRASQENTNQECVPPLVSKLTRVYHELNDQRGVARCLGMQALCAEWSGNKEAALGQLQELEAIARRLNDKQLLESCLSHRERLERPME